MPRYRNKEIMSRVRRQSNNQKLMTIYNNVPNYYLSDTTKKYTLLSIGNVKNRIDNNNTQSRFSKFL